MALNASLTPADAYKGIIAQAIATRTYLRDVQRPLLLQPIVNSSVGIAIIQHFWSVIPTMTSLAATPGILAYARAQKDDPAFDVQAQWVALRDSMIAARDGLIALFPKNAGGMALYVTITATGFVYRDFTDVQVAPAIPLIDAVIAAT